MLPKQFKIMEMKGRTITFILLLLTIFIQQHPSQAIQSLNDFFPFGSAVGDTIMEPNDDGSYGPISLPHNFPYFDNNHRQIYQANNGLFSFLGPISTFVPEPFPLADDRRLITPFWSDIDTRGSTYNSADNKVSHQIYNRGTLVSSNSTNIVFSKVESYVRQYFPRESRFEPVMVIVGTWYRVGYFSSMVDKLNTFQIALATDEDRSFAFFLYNNLQWGRNRDTAPYAQAGFNAGDGYVFTMLSYSRTENITALVNESNVNVPGLFAFRVDTDDIEAGGCSTNEPLKHSPVRGQQIGGNTITFQGPCFSPSNSSILCSFGDFGTVRGLIINEFRAVCLSPLAPYSGTVKLSVSFDEGQTFIQSGSFTYMPITDDVLITGEIIIRKNGSDAMLLTWTDIIELEWNFSEAALTGLTPNAVFEIEYETLKERAGKIRQSQRTSNSDVGIGIQQVIVLASDIPAQSGRQTMTIDLSMVARKHQRIIPTVDVVIGVFRVAAVVNRAYKVLTRAKTAVKMIQVASNYGCHSWSTAQDHPSTWNGDLLPCPMTLRQATVAIAQYEPDAACRVGGTSWANCWFHQGRPEFNEDNATSCFRSKGTNKHGAGAQCCYNKDGQIITRGTGAGTDDRYHSGNSPFKHFFADVLPFLACCKVIRNTEMCDRYPEFRPIRPGSNTMGQFGGTWGDPHFLTLDGTSYTFNGHGEYIYLAIPAEPSISFNERDSMQFESQIRTIPIGSTASGATVIKAFAARAGSMKISVTVSRRNRLLVHVNDDELTFVQDLDVDTPVDIITLRFDNVSITKNITNDQCTLSWPIGVSIQITPVLVETTSTVVLNVAAAVSGSLKGNWTLGLIGNYDGNPENDLRTKNGTVIGTVKTLTNQQIHNLFGITWAIAPSRSLFYYENNENATYYASQNLVYRPVFFEPNAVPLGSNFLQVCGIPLNSTNASQWSFAQRTCYYDAFVTNDSSFALASRHAADQQVEQRESIRNPPKFNDNLSFVHPVQVGQKVNLLFTATSEFSTTIIYTLLNGPDGARFDRNTGQFEWTVPEPTTNGSRLPVKVRAEDDLYHLVSTHEVLFTINPKSNARSTPLSISVLALFMLMQLLNQCFLI